jgi:hypothetical protein
MVDAAQDELYENTIKGTTITAIDLTLDTVAFVNSFSSWWSLHTSYYGLGESQHTLTGVTSIPTALDYYKFRVPYDWAVWSTVTITPITNIFPPEDLTLGDHVFTGDVFTAGPDSLDATAYGGAQFAMSATTTIGASAYTLSGTFLLSDLTTTATATATLATTSPSGTQAVFGQETLGADTIAGATVVTISTTTQFAVGETVLLNDPVTGNNEVGVIDSISAGVSITLDTGTRAAYVSANGATVTPLYHGISAATASSGTAGDTCDIVPAPDRVYTI